MIKLLGDLYIDFDGLSMDEVDRQLGEFKSDLAKQYIEIVADVLAERNVYQAYLQGENTVDRLIEFCHTGK